MPHRAAACAAPATWVRQRSGRQCACNVRPGRHSHAKQTGLSRGRGRSRSPRPAPDRDRLQAQPVQPLRVRARAAARARDGRHPDRQPGRDRWTARDRARAHAGTLRAGDLGGAARRDQQRTARDLDRPADLAAAADPEPGGRDGTVEPRFAGAGAAVGRHARHRRQRRHRRHRRHRPRRARDFLREAGRLSRRGRQRAPGRGAGHAGSARPERAARQRRSAAGPRSAVQPGRVSARPRSVVAADPRAGGRRQPDGAQAAVAGVCAHACRLRRGSQRRRGAAAAVRASLRPGPGRRGDARRRRLQAHPADPPQVSRHAGHHPDQSLVAVRPRARRAGRLQQLPGEAGAAEATRGGHRQATAPLARDRRLARVDQSERRSAAACRARFSRRPVPATTAAAGRTPRTAGE